MWIVEVVKTFYRSTKEGRRAVNLAGHAYKVK